MSVAQRRRLGARRRLSVRWLPLRSVYADRKSPQRIVVDWGAL